MAHRFVTFAISELPEAVAYSLMVGIVQPRPIAFLSTISSAGEPNLAPFSFFMLGGANPPSLMVSPVLGPGGAKKDSLRNIEATGEFVVNTLHRAMAEGMNKASYNFPPGVSEWTVGGFTPAPSIDVHPPRVAESLASFECKLFKVVEHGDGPGAARYVIGEILRIHLAEDYWTGDSLAPFRPISRMGGPEYLDTDAMEVFSLSRPTAPPE